MRSPGLTSDESLFTSQRHYGINAHRPAAGDVAGKKGHNQQKEWNGKESDGIMRAEAKHHAGEDTGDAGTQDQATSARSAPAASLAKVHGE